MFYKKNKYGNKKVSVDGIKFDSKKEAKEYIALSLMAKAGLIRQLELQPEFELLPKFKYGGKTIRAIKYIADFKYYDIKKNKWIIIDTKGFKTDVYNLKKKMLLNQIKDNPNIEFKEI